MVSVRTNSLDFIIFNTQMISEKNFRWVWLVITLFIASMPLMARVFVAIPCWGTCNAFSAKEFLYFCLALNLSNLTLPKSIGEKSLKYIIFGASLILAFFSTFIVHEYLSFEIRGTDVNYLTPYKWLTIGTIVLTLALFIYVNKYKAASFLES